ncbi:hypothetical protein [Jeotgalibacillus salarius]|uniref:hypothetical protein n=1 Tax=Jeotgalibacillus salarius TaxID=546023 RepID=UPI00141ACEDF|nr:hypothetical protein [Jeotgalibacillus salarius]
MNLLEKVNVLAFIDDKQHIFIAGTGNEIVDVIVTKKENIPENIFVKARKV